METVTAKRLRIYGQVQGVGYRESMRREAERLNLSGWVRNRFDGTVEALVCGNSVQVELLVAWARRGPRYAAVAEVVVTEAEALPSGQFEIIFTESRL